METERTVEQIAREVYDKSMTDCTYNLAAGIRAAIRAEREAGDKAEAERSEVARLSHHYRNERDRLALKLERLEKALWDVLARATGLDPFTEAAARAALREDEEKP